VNAPQKGNGAFSYFIPLNKFDIWFFSFSRLETRSKESNKKARVRVILKLFKETRNESDKESKDLKQIPIFFEWFYF